MAIDKEKLDKFQGELQDLLDKFGYKLVVCPLFIDKLGHKHPITAGGEISAELQVNEKDNGTD